MSTIHTMVAGVCCGLGIPSNGIARHGTAMDKTKSLGRSERAQAAREKASNREIVRFQTMVGGAERLWDGSPEMILDTIALEIRA